MTKSTCVISDYAAKTIEFILSKGDRVELIPTKDGVKIVRIRREPIKIEHITSP